MTSVTSLCCIFKVRTAPKGYMPPKYISRGDTDSNKSFDFLLNPICIVVVLLSYSVLLSILFIYYTNKIKFKPSRGEDRRQLS